MTQSAALTRLLVVVSASALGLSVGGAGCASAPVGPPAQAAEGPTPITAMPGLEPMPIVEEAPPAPTSAPGQSRSGSTADDGDPAASDSAGEGTATPLPVVVCTAMVGGRVRRSALRQTLDAGLGNWLRGVEIEPAVDQRKRFQGWLIRAIHTGDPCWTDVDLRAGDIVSRVNRRPLQRPEDAQAVWTALRGTGEIVVDYLRDGKARKLRFPVVNDRD